MSVILGIHLLDKLFLVSDTRETIECESGIEYRDDLIKSFIFSDRCSAVAAGRTNAASYLLNGILTYLYPNASIDEVMHIFKTKTKQIISEFVNKTGHHNKQVAIIIAGFNDYKGKEIVSSRLGDALSGELVALGEGSSQSQSINPLIVESLSKALISEGQLDSKSTIIVPTINSKMYSVVIDIRSNTVDIDEVTCYDGIIFHPNQEKECIEIPAATISCLDFRHREDPYADDVLYEDVEHVMSFLNKEIKKRDFKTVGGHIFSLLQTVYKPVFPTGDIATIVEGKIVKLGSLYVDPSGRLSYEFADGRKGEYRYLRDLKPYDVSDMSLI